MYYYQAVAKSSSVPFFYCILPQTSLAAHSPRSVFVFLVVFSRSNIPFLEFTRGFAFGSVLWWDSGRRGTQGESSGRARSGVLFVSIYDGMATLLSALSPLLFTLSFLPLAFLTLVVIASGLRLFVILGIFASFFRSPHVIMPTL